MGKDKDPWWVGPLLIALLLTAPEDALTAPGREARQRIMAQVGLLLAFLLGLLLGVLLCGSADALEMR